MQTIDELLAGLYGHLVDAGYDPMKAMHLVDGKRCPAAIEVTSRRSARTQWVCGCGAGCYRPSPPQPPTCICGDSGTHRPEPGVGCTRPGCLCLEPAEPAPRRWPAVDATPVNPGRSVR